MDAAARSRFEAADANKDGALSGDELQKMKRGRGPHGHHGGHGQHKPA